MSSAPDSPPAPQEPARHSYDSLFGEPPEPAAATQSPAGPTSYDDPSDGEEPYLPPAARAQESQLLSENHLARGGSEPAQPGTRSPAPARQVGLDLSEGEVESVRAANPVDTGRLYHSSGVEGPVTGGAIPARPHAAPAAGSPPAAPAAAEPSRPAVALTAAPSSAGVRPGAASERMEGVAPPRTPKPAPLSVAPAAEQHTDRGLTYLGVLAVVGLPTLVVGLAQALIWHTIGWPTGLVLALTSLYAALSVRRPDFSAAIVVPPLAFLVTTLVAGQLTLTAGGSLLVRQGFMIVRTLAENAPWILGATVLAAVIVIVRRRRA